jgi:cellulose synthase/poly-beta-1,6-N-acetylglucosamine synthase-like glycosyltransferase
MGYAVLSRVLSLFCGRIESPNSDLLPSVSLIIPAYNEASVLRQKLENSLALDYPHEKLVILIADDCSSDDTPAIASQFCSDRVWHLRFSERRGKAAAIVDAARASTGELLLLCDANVYFAPDALRKLVGHFADESVGAVTGTVVLQSSQSNFGVGEEAYYSLERVVQESESRIGSLMGVDGGMYVIRRELFPELPADTLLDDFVASMNVIRSGQRIVYEPLARASECGTPAAAQEYRRRKRMAAGAVQSILRGHVPPWNRPVIWWQYISHKLLRWQMPWILLALFIVNAVILTAHPAYAMSMAVQLLFYGAATFGALFVSWRRFKLFAVPFYFAMGAVAIAVGSVRGLLRREASTWTPTLRQPVAAK